jgi:hypothetical protein
MGSASPCAGAPGRLDDVVDGEVLGRAWAGGEEVPVAWPVAAGRPLDRAGVLGVHDQQAVEGGQRAQVVIQVRRVQRRELLHAGGQQEALEAEHAGVVQSP